MALTVTARGASSTNTAGQSTLVITPASSLALGSRVVLFVAYDNAGASGADPYSSITDSVGTGNASNVGWERWAAGLNDPGAASAGMTLSIFTALLFKAPLTTSDTITVTFSTTVVARAWALWEIAAGTGMMSTVLDQAATAQTSATPSIASSNVTSGGAIIAAIAREANGTRTDDADTTNGNWSAGQKSGIGTTTSGAEIISQAKVVSASGAQTFNPTFGGTSADGVNGWISFIEAVRPIVTPGVASLTLTTFAPTVTVGAGNVTVTPGTASLALSTFAPVLQHQLTPGTATLALSTFAPSIGQGVVPATVSLTLSAFAPTVTATDHKTVTPAPASLSLTAFDPTVTLSDHQTVTPSTAALTLSTFAPTVTATDHKTVTPAPASLSLTAFDPTVTLSDHQTVTPSTAALTLSTFAPTVSVTDATAVVPGTASLTLTTFAPTVTATAHQVVTPSTASLSMTAFAPDVVLTDHKLVTPGTASLVLTTFRPRLGPPVDWDRVVGIVTAGGAASGVVTVAQATGSVSVDALSAGALSSPETRALITTDPELPGVAS